MYKGNPEVSVVMGVYNGADTLRTSIDSILSQNGVDLELIIVNDGSADRSGQILDEYQQKDSRIKTFYQDNQGLTKALIKGCGVAKGKYIARQDAGDVSNTFRFRKQVDLFEAHPNAVLASCGTRFIGPEGEHLYDVMQDPSTATKQFLTLDPKKIKGPSHHGCTMFRRSIYEKVGGYRSCFYFAQDLDLWIRLVEHGEHVIVPETLYQALISVESISGLYRKKQIEITKLILES
ncbi:glycosyltransferase, partial [Dolichospermum sp. ST_sed3]|nr:glycosyltransferase [Dolichospermum sp. ST_sed3]